MLRKVALLLSLWLVLLVLALSTGWNAVWLLVYSLGLLIVGSALWANGNVMGLELRRRHRATRVQVGDTFVEQAVLEAGSSFMTGPTSLATTSMACCRSVRPVTKPGSCGRSALAAGGSRWGPCGFPRLTPLASSR
jgi:hypothetical protein